MKNRDVDNIERLQHINYVMEEIHDLVDDIYESFVDDRYPDLTVDVKKLNRRLKDLVDSIQDEI
tara:strand:- start:163 stop:354 length:192 start_codon:yes stop_codon:yes gene_type:complete